VSALIRERSDIGTNIRKEEKEYWEARQDEEEKKVEQAENARKIAEEDAKARKQQTYFLEAALTIDNRTSLYNTHVIKCNAEDIDINMKFLLKTYPELGNTDEFRAIAFAVNKIIMTARNFAIINYDFKRNIEHDDLGCFIEQYFRSIATEDPHITIRVDNKSKSNIRFPYQDITMMLYNIISNSKRSNATELNIKIYNIKDKLTLKFIDNGDGIDADIDLTSLFDFGVSYRRGTGVGLAQVKHLVVNELNGEVYMSRNTKKGVTLEINIPNENIL
jgi:K+-sensing histidine kinase KdpD